MSRNQVKRPLTKLVSPECRGNYQNFGPAQIPDLLRQNQLQHAIEVARIAALISEEIAPIHRWSKSRALARPG